MALLTLLSLLRRDMTSSLEHINPEIAPLIIALETPAFLRMILDAELASEAPDTEVDHMMVVVARDLGSQQQVLIGLRILSDPHYSHELL